MTYVTAELCEYICTNLHHYTHGILCNATPRELNSAVLLTEILCSRWPWGVECLVSGPICEGIYHCRRAWSSSATYKNLMLM